MGTIEIGGIDKRQIEARALKNKRSIEDEVRAILSELALPSPEKRLAEADRIRAMTPKGVKQTNSVELMRAIRDRRHLGH
jgi:plasmid stability protein